MATYAEKKKKVTKGDRWKYRTWDSTRGDKVGPLIRGAHAKGVGWSIQRAWPHAQVLTRTVGLKTQIRETFCGQINSLNAKTIRSVATALADFLDSHDSVSRPSVSAYYRQSHDYAWGWRDLTPEETKVLEASDAAKAERAAREAARKEKERAKAKAEAEARRKAEAAAKKEAALVAKARAEAERKKNAREMAKALREMGYEICGPNEKKG